MPATHRLSRLAAAVAILSLPVAGVAANAAPEAAGAAAGPGVVNGQSYVRTSHVYTLHDGPTGTHTTTIDTYLYVPKDATASTPAPAILATNGFGLSKDAPEMTATGAFYASHGYVVLTYTGAGFGGSGGCIQLDSADYDAKDASGLISVLGAMPFVAHDARGPLVGMTGGSYGGGITLVAAEHDPRIRAIAPGRTWNSLQYALDPNNLIVPGDPTGFSHQLVTEGVFKAEWTSLFYALGNAQPAMGNGGCPQDKVANAASDPVNASSVATCPGYYLVLCQTYGEVAATGDLTAAGRSLLAGASGETGLAALDVPTLLLQGQSDTLFNENDAAATYLSLKSRGVPVEWIWNSGGHGGYNSLPGEGDVYGGGDTGLDSAYLTVRTLQWFDRWLRGDHQVRTGPGFAYYRDWIGASLLPNPVGPAYAGAPSYPEYPMTAFALSGTSGLTPLPGPVTPGTATFVNPAGGEPASYSETSNFSAPGEQFAGVAPTDPAGEAVSFTTAPLARDTISVGIPSAHLQMSHLNGQDLVFFAKVFDVAPDGTATLIHRLVAPVRVPAADTGAPVDLHLLGFAHLFPAGHRIRLTLAATDQTSYNSRVADAITVRTGGADPSRVLFPLAPAPGPLTIGSAAAPAASGPGGPAAQGGAAAGAAAASLAFTGSSPATALAALALVGVGAAVLRTRRRTPAGR